jgi:hypothetical protein
MGFLIIGESCQCGALSEVTFSMVPCETVLLAMTDAG